MFTYTAGARPRGAVLRAPPHCATRAGFAPPPNRQLHSTPVLSAPSSLPCPPSAPLLCPPRAAALRPESDTTTDDPACFGGTQTASCRANSLHPSFAGRFGFHNATAIDNLLDKEDVSLEAILDDDDLLQECKAQNTRLIDYFSRVDVLQRLLGYVTGQIESDERGSFK